MKKKSDFISILIFVFVFVFVSVFVSVFSPLIATTPPDYWPTTQWKVSTPEQQGLDSQKLIEFIEKIKQEDRQMHSILIIRRGRLVTEAYFSPYRKEMKHIIMSATKSISSLLIGLAVKDGYIKDVNQPVLDFFPEYKGKVQNLDERKKSLQLFHLLTMTDGLEWTDWPYRIGMEGDFLKLLSAADGVKYYLDKPIKGTPGKKFNYNSGSSYMLSAIIQKCTGKSALEYAREKLFKPLGISDTCWGTFQQGINNGGSELFLKPRDMARIGYLVLHNGCWEGVPLFPAQWLEQSTKVYTKSEFLYYNYGYAWYIDTSLPFRNISAQGLGGQYIYVIPELDMVVVFTGGMVVNRDEEDIQYYYLRDYILAAVKSPKPLPPNPEANEKLNRLIDECRDPKPKPVPPLPPLAPKISGKTFCFDTSDTQNNPLTIESAALIFNQKNESRVRFTFPDKPPYVSMGFDGVYRTNPYSERLKTVEFDVGLDNVYRTTMIKTEIAAMPYFARGTWQDDRTFIVHSLSAWSLPEKIVFTFENPETLTILWSTIFFKFSITSTRNEASEK